MKAKKKGTPKLSCFLILSHCYTLLCKYMEKKARFVAGKSQFWLFLELFLWLALCCFCYYNHIQWSASENPAPVPDCQTQVPFFSSQRNNLTLPTCEWLQERRNEHIPSTRWPFLEMFCKTDGPFTLLPHSLSLSVLSFHFTSSRLLFLVLQKNLESRPLRKMVILRQ